MMDRQKERILDYLYGDMSPPEREGFEAELAGDSDLRRLFEAEQQLNRAHPPGRERQVPEAFLRESRQLLHLALRQEGTRRRGFWGLAAEFLSPATPQVRLAVGAVAVLLLGVFLGRTALRPSGMGDMPAPAGVSHAGLVGQRPLDIRDLRITVVDPSTGRVKLSFDAAYRVVLEGSVRDGAVEQVLAAALYGDFRPASRLEAVDLLQDRMGSAGIREALIHALLHDDNPGVRLKAIEALKVFAHDVQVRKALQEALLRDLNPGVRVEAVETLRDFGDAATLRVLARKAEDDENAYVRAEAGRAIQRWRSENPAEQTLYRQ